MLLGVTHGPLIDDDDDAVDKEYVLHMNRVDDPSENHEDDKADDELDDESDDELDSDSGGDDGKDEKVVKKAMVQGI